MRKQKVEFLHFLQPDFSESVHQFSNRANCFCIIFPKTASYQKNREKNEKTLCWHKTQEKCYFGTSATPQMQKFSNQIAELNWDQEKKGRFHNIGLSKFCQSSLRSCQYLYNDLEEEHFHHWKQQQLASIKTRKGHRGIKDLKGNIFR